MLDKDSMVQSLDNMEEAVRSGLKTAIQDMQEFRAAYDNGGIDVRPDKFSIQLERKVDIVRDYAVLRNAIEDCKSKVLYLEEKA